MHAAEADVILTLKEQPVRLLNQSRALGATTAIACLHRSDPENQGNALSELRTAIDTGVIDFATLCADSAKKAYVDADLPEDKMEVIVNGIDLNRFKPSIVHRQTTREQLAIGTDDPVVMLVARYDPMKNIPLFLESTGKYLAADPKAHVVMCGAGMTSENEELLSGIRDTCNRDKTRLDRIHLLGARRDMEVLYPAADIISLTSDFGEAYPLCLLEGMACGAIPVSTDVGDTQAMLGNGRGIITTFSSDNIVSSWRTALERRDDFALSQGERLTLGRDDMITRYEIVIRRNITKKWSQALM